MDSSMMEGTPPPMPSTTELLYTCAGVEWWCDDVVGRGEERRRCEWQAKGIASPGEEEESAAASGKGGQAMRKKR
jgi:hypothetical protein